jgi:hypothetical protein
MSAPADVVAAAEGELATDGPIALGIVAVLAGVAWTIKGAFVAWRTASKATNKVGT